MTTPVEKYDFIINKLSGTVLRKGEADIRDGLTEAFGDKHGDILFVDGKDISSTVCDWAEKNAGKGRALVIGGGDGTVLTAAVELLGHEGVTLGVLPLGTHNLFARQNGFSADFRKAAAQYKNSEAVKVDIGMVNDMHFLCGLMVDDATYHFYSAREDLRVNKRGSGIKKLFKAAARLLVAPPKKLNVSTQGLDAKGGPVTGRVITIMNNKMSPLPLWTKQDNDSKIKAAIENALAKKTYSDGEVALYAINAGPIDSVTILPSLLKGKWTQHNSVMRVTSSTLYIKPTDSKGKGGDMKTTVVLDGEMKETTYPLTVKSLRGGLSIFKPK